MDAGKRAIGVAAILFGAIISLTALPCGGFAATQKAAKPSTSEEASPKEIQELMTLLGDPKVRNWIEQQSKAQAAAEQAATEESVSQVLDGRLAAIREHLAALAGTVPDLPNQFLQGRARVTADLGENGRTKALLLLAFFVGLGTAVEWLFRKATQGVRGRLDTLPLEPRAIACASSRCVLPLRSVWWRPLPLAASARSSPSIGRHCCARCCSACSSRFLSCGSPMSSATSCWRRTTSASASCRWIRWPRISGTADSFGLSDGLPLVG
jgi:hypothetical protein